MLGDLKNYLLGQIPESLPVAAPPALVSSLKSEQIFVPESYFTAPLFT